MNIFMDSNLHEPASERDSDLLSNAPLSPARFSDGRLSGAKSITFIVNLTTTTARGLSRQFSGTTSGPVLRFTWFHVPEITVKRDDGTI